MNDITALALIAKIKKQTESFDTVVLKEAEAKALVEALEKAQAINAAAEKLVRCKGRYHSEQNYRALAALFGVNTPDLPQLESESRTVTVKLPKAISVLHRRDFIDAHRAIYAYPEAELNAALAAAGINVEAE